ncbi:uncharacterized protein LOC144910664 isoform X1 [Branchiostoma floridae x Branchiostoma belcheri]
MLSILLLALSFAVVPGRVIEEPSAFDCSNLVDGKFYGDTVDCATYHLCLVGRAFTLQCPDGLYWDQGNKVCDAKAKVLCKTSQVKQICINNPCMNGGTCSDVINGYECACAPGWRGKDCNEADHCWSAPCHNGGMCTEDGTGYKCACLPGWQGNSCDEPDPCASFPCANGGLCMVALNTYTCMCPEGWHGVNCQDKDVDLCQNNPCQNGGHCMKDGPADYSCLCPIGWGGKNCETSASCMSSPCLNGGVCVEEPTGFSCRCQSGWVGDHCEFGCQDPPSLFTCPDTWSLKWLDGTGIRHLTGNDSYCADVFCYPPYFTGFAGSPTYLHDRVELDRVHAFQALRYMTESGQDINSENGLALQHVFFSVLDYAERQTRSGQRVWKLLGPIKMQDGACCQKYGLGTYYRATEAFHFMGML